jgi:hypothetical protein
MCVGPVALALTDAAITLWGQAPEYWSEGYRTVREHNPLAHLLLAWHPAAFVVGIVAWAILIALTIHRLPLSLARVFAFFIMMGHALGVTTWLLHWRYGLIAVAVLFLMVWLLDKLIWKSTNQEVIHRR